MPPSLDWSATYHDFLLSKRLGLEPDLELMQSTEALLADSSSLWGEGVRDGDTLSVPLPKPGTLIL